MTITLRPYQQEAVEAIRDAYKGGAKSPLFALPTGGGKTWTFAYIAQQTALKGTRVCILVHRDHLIRQCSDALRLLGVPHGVIAPGYAELNARHVQIASVQTLARRLHRWADAFDLFIVDEAHHAVATTWSKIFDRYPTSKRLGVTATPIRLDGRGLIKYFDRLIVGPSMGHLIDKGFLAKYRIFAPRVKPDMSGLKKRAGDFQADGAAAVMDRPTITGDAVEHYRKHLNGLPAIAFCCTIAHAKNVARTFQDAGIPSAVIEGANTHEERKALIEGLASGSIKVLASCDVISEGVDIPTCQGAILLRPTESLTLYLQQVGRALRPKPDGSAAVILDHAANSQRHGLPDDPRVWDLSGGLIAQKAVSVRTCENCFAIYSGNAKECPSCGHVPTPKMGRTGPALVAGTLEEIEAAVMAQERRLLADEAVQKELERLKALARMRGYREGWAYHMWRGKVRKRAKADVARGGAYAPGE